MTSGEKSSKGNVLYSADNVLDQEILEVTAEEQQNGKSLATELFGSQQLEILDLPPLSDTKVTITQEDTDDKILKLDGDIPLDLEPENGQRFLFISYDQSALTHGLHKYPAKFFPELPRWLIQKYSNEGAWVLDPFTGSGTVNVECLLARRHSVGIDVDPFSKLLSRVKVTPLDIISLEKSYRWLRSKVFDYRAENVREEDIPKFPYQDNWFNKEIQSELTYLKNLILDLPEGPLYSLETLEAENIIRFFLILLSSNIRSVSNADDHCTRTVIRKRLNKRVNPGDALQKFIKAMDTNVPKMVTFSETCPRDIEVEIPQNNDARQIMYPDEFFDLAITSPPYVNAVDYPRTHQLESYWLGLAKGSLTPLKRIHIGTESVQSRDYLTLKLTGIDEADEVLRRMYEEDPRRAYILYKFLKDMERNLVETRRVLKPNGKYVIAIGNNRIRGHVIENWRYIMTLAERVGFNIERYFASQIIRHFIKVPREERIQYDWIVVLSK